MSEWVYVARRLADAWFYGLAVPALIAFDKAVGELWVRCRSL